MKILFSTALTLLIGGALWAAGETGVAELKNPKGEVVGKLTLKGVKDGVRISGAVSNLPAGGHALHIHEVGSCEAPDFKSAGPHFNPHKKQHGDMNPQGSHAGDLPNITVGANGKAKINVTAKNLSMGDGTDSVFKSGGTAVVIHAKEDDRKSDPAGNAGDRIACGVIAKK